MNEQGDTELRPTDASDGRPAATNDEYARYSETLEDPRYHAGMSIPDAHAGGRLSDDDFQSIVWNSLNSFLQFTELSPLQRERASNLLRVVVPTVHADLEREISAWRRASRSSRTRRSLRILLTVPPSIILPILSLLTVGVALYYFGLLFLRTDIVAHWNRPPSALRPTPLISTGFVALGLAEALAASYFIRAWRIHDRPSRRALKAHSAFRTMLLNRAEDESTRAINRLNEQASNDRIGLFAAEGARLVELDRGDDLPDSVIRASDQYVETESLHRVREFVLEHTASALGISGSRGAGKTSIMRSMTAMQDEEFYSVYIACPVRYERADFVRLLHFEVASQVLRQYQLNRTTSGRQDREAAGKRAAIAGLAAVALFIIAASGSPVSAGIALLGVGMVVSAFLFAAEYLEGDMWDEISTSSGKIPQVCEQAMERLTYSTQTQISSSISGVVSAMTFGRTKQFTRAERDRSHPERVMDFRNFISALRRSDSSFQLIVSIDEMDKLPAEISPVDVVNDIKDLLHQAHTHFLVSVSKEAFNSFQLRNAMIRDAFDSTFDEIIQVDDLTIEAAVNLLGRRALWFHEAFSVYSCVVAEGIPREIIRTARLCLEAARRLADQGTEPELSTVIAEASMRLAVNVRDSLVDSLRGEDPDFLFALKRFQMPRAVPEAGELTAERLGELYELIRSHEYHEEHVGMADAAALTIARLMTAGEIFPCGMTAANWLDSRSEIVEKASILARIKVGSSEFVSVHIRELSAFRENCGLAAIA